MHSLLRKWAKSMRVRSSSSPVHLRMLRVLRGCSSVALGFQSTMITLDRSRFRQSRSWDTQSHRRLQALFTSKQSITPCISRGKNCMVWKSCRLQKPFFSSSCLFCFAFVGQCFLVHISTANKDIKYLHVMAILVACGVPVQSVHDVALGV